MIEAWIKRLMKLAKYNDHVRLLLLNTGGAA